MKGKVRGFEMEPSEGGLQASRRRKKRRGWKAERNKRVYRRRRYREEEEEGSKSRPTFVERKQRGRGGREAQRREETKLKGRREGMEPRGRFRTLNKQHGRIREEWNTSRRKMSRERQGFYRKKSEGQNRKIIE